MEARCGSSARLWSALILIALGVLLLLDRFGMIRFGRFINDWWPSILIAIGLWQLFVSRPRHKAGAIILLILGIIFQVDRFNIFPWWSPELLWPAALIGVGLWMLLGRMRASATTTAVSGGSDASAEGATSPGETIDAFALFSGFERVVTSRSFRGGDASAVFGAVKIDLRQAELAAGEQRLHLTALFGGIEVRVPSGWQVSVEGTPVLGGIEDKRGSAGATNAATPSAGNLRIHAFAAFGGIKIED
jgi:hypothetical protein